MIYSYCRISRPQQSIQRQIRNVLEYEPKAKIYQEAFTGTSMDRPEWNKLMKLIKPNDTIIFDSVSRMSRTAEEGFDTYEELYKKQVNLVFLKEPHINTDVYKTSSEKVVPMTGTKVDIILDAINKYLMELAKEQIRIAFEQSQKEVDDLHARVSEGLKTAKLNGKTIGRKEGSIITTKKSVAAKEIIKKHSKRFGGSLSDNDCQILCGISRNSYYKYKSELIKELCEINTGEY